MDFNEYQNLACKTAIYPEKYDILYTALGLASEVGEVCGKIKKVLRDNDGVFSKENKQEIADELGDCQWYIATLASDLDFLLDTICINNLEKLKSRQERNVLSGSGDNR